MNIDRLAKWAFYAVVVTLLGGLPFLFGLYSGGHRNFAFVFVKEQVDKVERAFDDVMETDLLKPGNFLQPARYQGSGVTLNLASDKGEYLLLSGFFGEDSGLQLIRRDGALVNKWVVRYSEVFADSAYLADPPNTDWNVDIDGSLAMPDGSVVFNFDYVGLARIDRCGKVMWTVRHQTHHSVEFAERGGFWVPGENMVTDAGATRYPPFEAPFADSTIMLVSENGAVLREISVPGLFYENGLEALLTSAPAYYEPRGKNAWNREIVHLNKIAELSSELAEEFPQFEAGDLLLSMRNSNLLMVVDPDTEKVRWWQIGPWLRQHDPEFNAGGTIILFNNNVYLNAIPGGYSGNTTKLTPLSVPRVSNILEVDPETGLSRKLFGESPGQEMLSVTRGKVDLTPGGGLLVTEFDGGRVFETDSQGQVVWQYINRYNDDEVAEISEARLYPAGYFQVSDWSCTTP